MPLPPAPVSWTGSVAWLLALTLAAFVIAWIANRFDVHRRLYVALLALVTGVLTLGYVTWLGTPAGELLTSHWGWGLLMAPICAAPLIIGMRKQPATSPRSGRTLWAAMLWEGVVYGVAEGLLLSALPVLMTWQLIASLDLRGPVGTVARWTLPIVASVVVIVVHHLGYWEYRNRMLIPISVGCGLLSLGYLVTASPIAPTLGHVLGHVAGLRHGVELPPHGRSTTPVPQSSLVATRSTSHHNT